MVRDRPGYRKVEREQYFGYIQRRAPLLYKFSTVSNFPRSLAGERGRDEQDIRTDMYAGVAADLFCSGVSPSHDWREKTKETHPIILCSPRIIVRYHSLDLLDEEVSLTYSE